MRDPEEIRKIQKKKRFLALMLHNLERKAFRKWIEVLVVDKCNFH